MEYDELETMRTDEKEARRRRFADWRLLFSLWLKNPRKIGAVAVSSPELAAAARPPKDGATKQSPVGTTAVHAEAGDSQAAAASEVAVTA